MSDFIKTFESKNKKLFKKYKDYIKLNDWSNPIEERDKEGYLISSKYYFTKDIKTGDKGKTHEGKEHQFRLQNNIVKNTLGRLKYFYKHVEDDIGRNKRVDRLIKNMLWVINPHIERIEEYLKLNLPIDISEEEKIKVDVDARDIQSDNIDFENTLHKEHASITDEVRKLNLNRDNKDSLIQLKNDVKAPLSLRKAIENEYPDVKKYVKDLNIDFESKPNNKMLILMDEEDIPEWNPNKHYFEQTKRALQFYVDEFKKIKNGIKIDGVYISGWMYCHLNIFKNPIPFTVINPNSGLEEVVDKIAHPPLRDNEWFIIQDNFLDAKKRNLMLFLAATRRAAKTTLIASYLQWKALSGGNELVVAGGSTEDLGHIEKKFRTTMVNADSPFYMPNITDDWTKKVKLGVKKKNQRNINPCTLNVVNLEDGNESASEKLAGFTPDAFVLDEIFKNKFKEQLDAALPAFEANGIFRFVPILSGTGNRKDMSKDSLMYLKNPLDNRVLPMNWKPLERGMDRELISWRRRDFATFLPGQMSIINSGYRIEKGLGEYLQMEDCPKLNQIRIQVTGWKKSLENLKNRRDKLTDQKSLIGEKVYFPIDPEEIFLSGSSNPFPREELIRYREALEETGDTGRRVTLSEEGDKVKINISEKDYPPLPFSGGFWDAPITIYEDPIENIPFEFYVAGLDDVKQEEADSDSVASLTIIRRDTGKVVASYHSRPDPKTYFHYQCYLLLRLYNCPVFMENADMDFKKYMDRRGETDYYIAKGADLLGDLSLNVNNRRKYGWQPTVKNKSYFLGNLIEIVKEMEEYEDDNGNIKTMRGFHKIKDLRIINELINYSEGGNFDTIISSMSAYAYDYYLTTVHGSPRKPKSDEEIKRQKELLIKERMRRKMNKNRRIYPNSGRGSTFSKPRR